MIYENYWRFLDIPDWEIHRDDILKFLENNPLSSTEMKEFELDEKLGSTTSLIWQCLEEEKIKEAFPKLCDAFLNLGLNVRFALILKFESSNDDISDTGSKNCPYIHIDEGICDGLVSANRFAINIPLLNCENSHTLFYSIKNERKEKYYTYYNQTGLDPECVNIESRLPGLTKPALLRTHVPHSVVNYSDKTRTVVTFRFYEDLEFLFN